jgi:hypothetical protein
MCNPQAVAGMLEGEVMMKLLQRESKLNNEKEAKK